MEKTLTNYITSIHDIVINDEQPEIQKLNKFINEVASALTLDSSTDVIKELKKIQHQNPSPTYMDICHRLFCRKFYISIPTEKRTFEEMEMDNDHIGSKKGRLINHTRFIYVFWKYYEKKIDFLIEQLIESKIHTFPSMIDTLWLKGLEAWRNLFFMFKEMIQTISPISQYIYSSYPDIFSKYIFKHDNFENYLNYKFHKNIQNKLNQSNNSYENYLKFSISNLIKNDNDIINKIDINDRLTPFRFAYLFNDTIDGQSIKDSYISILTDYLLSEEFKKSLFRQGYQGFKLLFLQGLNEQTLISSLFSPTWMEPIKNTMVETVLMNKNVITECYKLFKNENNVITNIKDNNDFGIFYLTFLSRSKTSVLDSIITDIVYEEIIQNYKPEDKTCFVSIFDNLMYQVLFFSNVNLTKVFENNHLDNCNNISRENQVKCIQESYIKVFVNESNLCQAIVQYIILKGKSLSSLALPEEYNLYLSKFTSVLESILKNLFISSSIIMLYSEALFRYILMNYSNLFKSMTVDGSNQSRMIEYIESVISLFEKVYKNDCKPLTLMWRHFKENIAKVSDLHKTNSNLKNFYPLILPQLDIPEMYQRINDENSLKNIRLPGKIREMWEKFEKDYKEVILKNGEHKVVHPLYGLQYCSVETPFMREDGTPLLLELTLYQTCVLNEFNEADKISFRDLVERLQMDGANVKGILNSFLNVGVIKMNKDKTFSVNEEFKADERKMKNGTLRVAMGKRLRKPLGESSHAVTDNGNNEEGMKDSENREGRSEEWNEGHHEGLSSVWKREVIKACIVRTVKSHVGRDEGISEEDLLEECLPQLLQGTSVGEFKDALTSAVRERYIKRNNDGMYVFDM